MAIKSQLTITNPSFQSLIDEEHRLHVQADKLLGMTDIFNILNLYGEVLPVGGSYAYGLMAYPDIDLGVKCKDVSKNEFANFVRDIIKLSNVRRISAVDTIHFDAHRVGRPKGYWLKIEIPFEEENWNIDCWLIDSGWLINNPDPYAAALHQLNSEKKHLIVEIKYQLLKRNLYGSTFFSNDVYDAVLHNDISSFEEFLAINTS
jgi:hypothetical protein